MWFDAIASELFERASARIGRRLQRRTWPWLQRRAKRLTRRRTHAD